MLSRLLALLLLAWASVAVPAPDTPKQILLLQSFRGALPVNRDFSAGIAKGLGQPAEFDTEALDFSRIDDEEYIRKLIDLLRLKYRTTPPDLILATYTPATRLLLDHDRELFPGIPVVFCAAELSPEELEQLPPNVTGVTSRRDFAGTLELMSRLHPGMRRVALIVGSSEFDKSWEQDAREALRPYESRFGLIWLRGLPLHELTEAVKALPSHTVILYLVQSLDRNGVLYVPRKLLRAVSTAASVPVYGLWDTLLGAGIVGGRLVSVEQQGVIAGQIARRILMGETPSAIPVVRIEQNETIVDARQLQRWNIDESLLPGGTRVLYRERSLWDEHRNALLVGGGVIALQALWIFALILNRRKLRRTQVALGNEYDHRVQVEEVARKLRARLGAAEKQSALGALAGEIAHEINQPLIAIKNYVQAAARYVRADSAHAGKLAELLAEMEGEAGRAGAIIQKIRKLSASGHVDAVPVELDPVLREVLPVMSPEAGAHGCRIDYRAETPVPRVLADALGVQLVMVNLLRNAIEAAQSQGEDGDRLILVNVRPTGEGKVELSVADRGPGVAAEDAEVIFESLYTTKATGMGIGLATCRTIVEAHGGQIWCTPNPAGGAIFRFTLPVAEPGT